MDIAAWLRSLGLECHAAAFAANAIDAEVLPSLTADDLKELGVVALGHRRKLLDAIAALREAAASVDPASAPRRAGAERRHLSVMFVDLVGSTQLSLQLDPEDMRTVLLAYQQAVAAAIARVEGNVAKYMGDGVLAYFGWPVAHENEGERAVRAGLAITAAVAQLLSPDGVPMAARVGIATGLVVVGDLIGEGAAQERAVVGDTPNLAARLQGLAAPGQVAIADSTRRLVGGMFEFTSLGAHELRGIAGRTPVFAVVGERALESRFAARAGAALSALVGRDEEFARLQHCWQQAQLGQGQLVLLTAEAGMGKSRLTEALVEHAAAAPHHRLRYQCSPYHQGSALHPVIQQLLQASGIQAADAPPQRLEKLAARLQIGAAAATAGDVALLASLLGIEVAGPQPPLSPQQQRFRTLQALTNHVLDLAVDRPVLCVLEDAHWIDPTTRDLLQHAWPSFAAARVCLVVTARPGAPIAFPGHPAVTRLELGKLSRQAVAAIAGAAAGGKPLPAELVEAIAERSDGVPLYVEEMARGALESGLLTEGPAGYSLGGCAASVAIPRSLHDSLMARLDRQPLQKHVAQTAAVIGRAFGFRPLAALCAMGDPAVQAALDALGAAELVFGQGVPPDASYLFKHALVRDAAYESLLKSTRQELHARLVAVLEALPDTPSELLAFHARAGNLFDKAIQCLGRAGDLAMARPAYEEAIGHYTQAVELAAQRAGGREAELELRTRLGLASISAKGHSHPDTCAIFAAALQMSGAVGRADLAFVSWYGLWCGHHVRSEVVLARHSSAELSAAATAVTGASHRLMGTRALAITAVMAGEFQAGLRLHEQARALHEPERDRAFAAIVGQDQAVSFRSYYALNLWVVGREQQAWQLAAESIELGKRTGHVNSLGYGYMHAALVALCARRPEAAVLTAEMIGFSTEHRLAMWREFGAQFDAILRLGNGESGALGDLLVARRALAARHANLFSSLLGLLAAERLVALGEIEAAEALVGAAQQAIERTGERYAEAEGHRLRGCLLAARGLDPGPSLAAAERVAQQQGALAFSARIAATRRELP